MSNEGNGGYSFLAGFFVGAALGAMAALLLAPKTGKELRQSLVEEGRKLREKTGSAVADIRQRGEEVYEKAREAFSEAAEGVRKAAQTITTNQS